MGLVFLICLCLLLHPSFLVCSSETETERLERELEQKEWGRIDKEIKGRKEKREQEREEREWEGERETKERKREGEKGESEIDEEQVNEKKKEEKDWGEIDKEMKKRKEKRERERNGSEWGERKREEKKESEIDEAQVNEKKEEGKGWGKIDKEIKERKEKRERERKGSEWEGETEERKREKKGKKESEIVEEQAKEEEERKNRETAEKEATERRERKKREWEEREREKDKEIKERREREKGEWEEKERQVDEETKNERERADQKRRERREKEKEAWEMKEKRLDEELRERRKRERSELGGKEEEGEEEWKWEGKGEGREQEVKNIQDSRREKFREERDRRRKEEREKRRRRKQEMPTIEEEEEVKERRREFLRREQMRSRRNFGDFADKRNGDKRNRMKARQREDPAKKYPLSAPTNKLNECKFNFSAEKDFEAIDKLNGERLQINYKDFEILMNETRGKSFDWLRIFNGEVYRPAEKYLGEYHKTLVPGYMCVAVQRMKDLGWKVPNGDFLFHLFDGPFCTKEARENQHKKQCKIPPLTHNSRKGRDFAIQIPWLPYIAINPEAHTESTEFQNKKFVAEWRGRLTGLGTEPFVGRENQMDFTDFPRARLVLASMNNTEVLDARFVGFPQKNTEVLDPRVYRSFQQLPIPWKKGSRLTRRQQSTYAFHVVIDGDFGQARLPYQLIMNSVVFRKKTNWTDHYEHTMRDGIDYVLFSTEDELISKIQNLQKNPQEAERIARNGRTFAKTCLTGDNFLSSFHSAISLYSDRLTYKIEDGGGVEPRSLVGKNALNVPNLAPGW